MFGSRSCHVSAKAGPGRDEFRKGAGMVLDGLQRGGGAYILLDELMSW